jgi:hypothetical protein
MHQASLTYTLKHQINRHREVGKFDSFVKRSRDHWNGRKVYVRRQRAEKTVNSSFGVEERLFAHLNNPAMDARVTMSHFSQVVNTE